MLAWEADWPIIVSIYDNFVFIRFSLQGQPIHVGPQHGVQFAWRLPHLVWPIPSYHAIYEKLSSRGTPILATV